MTQPTESLGDILRTAMSRRISETTTTTEPEPMTLQSNVVTFDMFYDGNAKIGMIRALRASTGSPLVTAKDTIEAACRKPVTIRMSEAQFGRFMAGVLADTFINISDITVTNISVGQPVPLPMDFSGMGAPTYSIT